MALRYWHGALVALVVAAGAARSQPDTTGYAPGPNQSLPLYSTKPEPNAFDGPAVRKPSPATVQAWNDYVETRMKEGAWVISVVEESKLQVLTPAHMKATCANLTIAVDGAEPVELTAAKQVRLRSGRWGTRGKEFGEGVIMTWPVYETHLRASADRVIRGGSRGEIVTLEGNARLNWVRKEVRVKMAADRIVFDLETGEVRSEAMRDQVPPPPPPAASSAPAAGDDKVDIFLERLSTFGDFFH